MKQTQMHLKSILISLFIFLHFTANESSQHPLQTKHFVLVHGSCHGAWSWFKLAALLKSSGHNVTALDLAASGVDPQQVSNLKSISDFFKPLMDFMAALPVNGKVILVGHSVGGLAVSHAMERFPNKISVAVFVTALMPGPGPDLDISTLSSKDWALATMLMRPLRLFSGEDMSKKLRLSKEKYGSVKRVFIICGKDLVIKKDLAWWMINHQVEEIEGSDHMAIEGLHGSSASTSA